MTIVQISGHFGVVIRKTALEKHGISLESLFEIMETEKPLDESQELISFGPHFGGEAVSEFIRRLEMLGLVYFDEFFDIPGLDVPEWCQLYAALKVTAS